MEIKIGIQHVGRELTIDTDASADDVLNQLQASDSGLLVLSDSKGRRVAVPVEKVAYVDFAPEHSRPVGFGSV